MLILQYQKRIFLFLFFAVLLTAGPCLAQSLLFKNFNVEHGLPSSEVHHVMQDSKGYLWFSTNNGVAKYDGYEFKTYAAAEGVPENLIFESREDKKERIWLRGLTGNFSYIQRDTVVQFKSNLPSLIKTYNYPASFYIDDRETLWVGSMIGSFSYDIKTGKQIPVKHNIYGYRIIRKLRNGGFIFSQYNEPGQLPPELIFIDERDSVIVLKSSPPTPVRNTIMRALKLKDGSFFLTSDNVVYHISAKGKLLGEKTVTEHAITALFEDKEKNIWVGLKNNGLLLFRKGNLEAAPENYLPDNTITSITQDKEGTYWFTSLENGVYNLYSTGIFYYDKTNGLSNNKIRWLTYLGKDSIAVAANNKLNIISNSGLTTINMEQYQKGDYVISSMIAFDGEGLYVSGSREGLLKYKNFNSPPALILKKLVNIKDFIYSKKGSLICASPIALFEIRDDSIIAILKIEKRANCLFETKNNTLLIGCIDGIRVKRNKQIIKLPIAELEQASVVAIKEVSGKLFIATKNNGLFYADTANLNKLYRIDIASKHCDDLAADEHSNLWVATNSGIVKIVQQNRNFHTTKYNYGNGLLANEITRLLVKDSTIYAATSKGLMKLYIKDLRLNTFSTPVYLTKFMILNNDYTGKVNLEFSHTENYITINYIGISYSTEKINYKYKMEGLDTTWRYTTNTSVQYPTLPPGNYKFVVYAINNNNIESVKPAEVKFFIDGPFWKKWWFYVFATAILLSALFLAFGLRVKYLRKQDVIDKKIKEIEMTALRAQMNPHFIFNCLGSIQNFILKNDADSAQIYLNKFSQLIRSVLETSAMPTIILSSEIKTLTLYIELEAVRFKGKFQYNIFVSDTINPETIVIPTMLIQPYVENAIWHGLMPKDEPGILNIIIEEKDDCLMCAIEDNGIGRKKSQELKANRKTHASFGMALTKERIEILNSRGKQKSSITILDLEDHHNKAIGTRVEILIPIQHTYD